jgi:hypothetical protein
MTKKCYNETPSKSLYSTYKGEILFYKLFLFSNKALIFQPNEIKWWKQKFLRKLKISMWRSNANFRTVDFFTKHWSRKVR